MRRSGHEQLVPPGRAEPTCASTPPTHPIPTLTSPPPPCLPRSQEDIANRRSMADARAAERSFFEAHPEYLEVASQVK